MIARRIWRKWWAWAAVLATLPVPLLVPGRWAVIDEVQLQDERVDALRDELRRRHGAGEPRFAEIANTLHQMGENPSSREEAAWSATRHRDPGQPALLASAPANELDLLALKAIEPLIEEWSALVRDGATVGIREPNYLTVQSLPMDLARAATARLSKGDLNGAVNLLEGGLLADEPLHDGTFIGCAIAMSMRANTAAAHAALLRQELDPAFVKQLFDVQAAAWERRPYHSPDNHWQDSVYLAHNLAAARPSDAQQQEPTGGEWSPMDQSQSSSYFLRSSIAKQLDALGEAEECERFLRGEDPGQFFFVRGSGAWTAPRFLRAQLLDLHARRPELLTQIAVPLPESLASLPEPWLVSLYLLDPNVPHHGYVEKARVMTTQSALVMTAYAVRVHHAQTGEWPESVEALSPELRALLQPMLDEANEMPPLEGAPVSQLLTHAYQGPLGPIRVGRQPLTRETAPPWVGLPGEAPGVTTNIEYSVPADATTGHQRGEMTVTIIGGANSLEGAVAALDAMGARDAIAGWNCTRDATFEWRVRVKDRTEDFLPTDLAYSASDLAEAIIETVESESTRVVSWGPAFIHRVHYRLTFTVQLPDAPLAVWSPGPDGVDDGALLLHSFVEEAYGKGDVIVWPEPR